MKQKSWAVRFLAWFLLLWGLVWLVTIYSRCQVIALRTEAGTRGVSGYNFIRTAKMFTGCSSNTRSSHMLLFWALAALEMMSSFLYLISGFALLRRYPLGFRMGRTALWADLFFKVSTAAYMFGIAVPLQNVLRGKQNILLNYFTPDRSVFSDFSTFFSGLRLYYPAVNFSLAVYLMYFVSTYLFIKQRVEEWAGERRA